MNKEIRSVLKDFYEHLWKVDDKTFEEWLEECDKGEEYLINKYTLAVSPSRIIGLFDLNELEKHIGKITFKKYSVKNIPKKPIYGDIVFDNRFYSLRIVKEEVLDKFFKNKPFVEVVSRENNKNMTSVLVFKYKYNYCIAVAERVSKTITITKDGLRFCSTTDKDDYDDFTWENNMITLIEFDHCGGVYYFNKEYLFKENKEQGGFLSI